MQAELKEVLALQKQLEQDVLAYRNLQTALQEQLSEIQRREGTHSFLWLSCWLFHMEGLGWTERNPRPGGRMATWSFLVTESASFWL